MSGIIGPLMDRSDYRDVVEDLYATAADACYTARGFMLALGCIQALQCNQNTCPVGITTHNPRLERGLDIGTKSTRVANYAARLCNNYVEMLAATGKTAASELDRDDLFHPGTHQGGAS